MPEAIVTFFGEKVKVGCDGNCRKAWGISSRPKVQLSDDSDDAADDYAFLNDNELGDAPADPGTYEGGYGKPDSSAQFPNKWCVRECERSRMSKPDQLDSPLPLPDFSKRQYNMHWRSADQDAQ